MPKYAKISRSLPITFANGNAVRQFAKHCVRCRQLVSGEHMYGVMTLVQDRIVLAAEAHCPHCQAKFPVTCVITDDKKVHRVVLPMTILRWWLASSQAGRPRSANTRAQDWEYPATPPVATPPPAPAVVQHTHPDQRSEDSIGRFQDVAIPAWVQVNGIRYVFARPVVDKASLSLAPHELLIDGCLIFAPEQRTSA